MEISKKRPEPRILLPADLTAAGSVIASSEDPSNA